MRSLVFEGATWEAYETMREKDKKLHKALCTLLKEMLRSGDPASGLGKPEPISLYTNQTIPPLTSHLNAINAVQHACNSLTRYF
jgi:hypothetical protein